jgi:hypothetical protein
MLFSFVSVFVVAQPSEEFQTGLMNYSVYGGLCLAGLIFFFGIGPLSGFKKHSSEKPAVLPSSGNKSRNLAYLLDKVVDNSPIYRVNQTRSFPCRITEAEIAA